MGVLYRFWKRVLIHRDGIRVFLSVSEKKKKKGSLTASSRIRVHAAAIDASFGSLQLHKSQPRFNRCHATTIVIHINKRSGLHHHHHVKKKQNRTAPLKSIRKKKGGPKRNPVSSQTSYSSDEQLGGGGGLLFPIAAGSAPDSPQILRPFIMSQDVKVF